MPGYDATMKDSSDVFGLREPEVMPDGLMGDKVRNGIEWTCNGMHEGGGRVCVSPS
jgi:hypothetical protein